MVISNKVAFIRNLSASIINGLITLILLLIAPLGLASVITNTIAVSISTFLVCSGLDLITFWLVRDNQPITFSHHRYPLNRQPRGEIELRNDE